MTTSTSYPGGKGQIVRQLINEIPPHSTYVAAFAGRDAIARHKRPSARTVLADLDVDVLGTWQAVPDLSPGQASGGENGEVADGRGVELWNCCGIDWLRFTFALDLASSPKSATLPTVTSPATEYFVAQSGHARVSPVAAMKYSGWFVYLDPPYLMETRRGGDLYRYELKDHGRLIKTALELPCPVMISGYWSEQYAAAFQDWRHITVNAVDRCGNVREEWVWMNYPEPIELHDDRYFGRTANDRYKSKLKISRMVARLKSMSHSERSAVIDAINTTRD